MTRKLATALLIQPPASVGRGDSKPGPPFVFLGVDLRAAGVCERRRGGGGARRRESTTHRHTRHTHANTTILTLQVEQVGGGAAADGGRGELAHKEVDLAIDMPGVVKRHAEVVVGHQQAGDLEGAADAVIRRARLAIGALLLRLLVFVVRFGGGDLALFRLAHGREATVKVRVYRRPCSAQAAAEAAAAAAAVPGVQQPMLCRDEHQSPSHSAVCLRGDV